MIRLGRISCITLLLVTLIPTDSVAQRPVNSRLTGPGIPAQGVNGWCWTDLDLGWPDGYQHVASIDLTLVGDVGIVAQTSVGAYGYASASVYVEHLPQTGTYWCLASYYVNGNHIGDGASYIDFYLTILDVTLNTFIPVNHEPDVRPGAWHATGQGDDRSFNRWGSFRTTNRLSIIDPRSLGNSIVDGPWPEMGLSQYYDQATSLANCGGYTCLTWAAVNDWTPGTWRAIVPWAFNTWDGTLKLAWAYGVGTNNCYASKLSNTVVDLICSLDAGTALLGWAPGINYWLKTTFWFHDDGRVEYLVQGNHDGYPNHELYVGDYALRIFDHRWYGQTLWSLGPPSEFQGVFDPGQVY